jgi:hypothetical protein
MDLGAALAQAGNEVVFAGLGPRPSPRQRQEAISIGTLEWGEAALDWMAVGPKELAGVSPWIERLVRAHAPDVLHLNLPSQAANLRGGPPRVVMTHSCLATWFRVMEGTTVPGHLAWQVEMTRAGLANADRVLAPTAAHAALTAEVYGITAPNVVRNASFAPLMPPSDGDGTIAAVARWWDKAKNGTVLDRAAEMANVPVFMIGRCEGPDGQALTLRHARAAGPMPHSATLYRIAAASLFVSPSLYEPFGLAALEAGRAGRPLLLADIPVYRELWDGAARYFDPHDPDDLAAAIRALLQSPDERIALGAAAQRRAQHFTPAGQARAMTEIYRAITASETVS